MTDDNQQARNWSMACHLAALTFYLGIPFGNILGPLVIWLFKRNEFTLVDEQGKEVLNFQISLLIYCLVAIAAAAIFAITLILIPLTVILVIFLACLFIINVIFIIIAAVNVSNGESYRYPLTIRFIK